MKPQLFYLHICKRIFLTSGEVQQCCNNCDIKNEYHGDFYFLRNSIVKSKGLTSCCQSQGKMSWVGLVWFDLIWFGLDWVGLLWVGLQISKLFKNLNTKPKILRITNPENPITLFPPCKHCWWRKFQTTLSRYGKTCRWELKESFWWIRAWIYEFQMITIISLCCINILPCWSK